MASLGGAPRNFIVGETVHLLSRVSIPGTRTPTDPDTVSLTSLTREDGVEVSVALPIPFTRVKEGEFTLSLPTVGLTPGTYLLVVTHATSTDRVTLATDQFVLQSI